jgi:hypothetical protein
VGMVPGSILGGIIAVSLGNARGHGHFRFCVSAVGPQFARLARGTIGAAINRVLL